MRLKAYALLLIPSAALFAITCSQNTSLSPTGAASSGISADGVASQGGTGALSANIQFGQDQGGSPFPPGSGHDHSFNGVDKLVPQSVVIDRGGTVTFTTFGVHEVAIYASGTTPEDIDTTKLEFPLPTSHCPPVPLIDDPHNRIAELGPQPCDGGPTTVKYTFRNPGTYLAICDFLPHFEEAKMYGYIKVR